MPPNPSTTKLLVEFINLKIFLVHSFVSLQKVVLFVATVRTLYTRNLFYWEFYRPLFIFSYSIHTESRAFENKIEICFELFIATLSHVPFSLKTGTVSYCPFDDLYKDLAVTAFGVFLHLSSSNTTKPFYTFSTKVNVLQQNKCADLGKLSFMCPAQSELYSQSPTQERNNQTKARYQSSSNVSNSSLAMVLSSFLSNCPLFFFSSSNIPDSSANIVNLALDQAKMAESIFRASLARSVALFLKQ